jgi:membrane protein DedA with SNARE-associated domain
VDPRLLDALTAHGSLALFGLLILGIVGLPVPDETLLIAAGVLVSHDRLNPTATYFAAISGAVVGITVSYCLGRAAGVTVIRKYGPRLRLKTETVEQTRLFFHRSGKWFLMFGYFLPGIRHFSALVAGAANVELGLFARFAYVGAVIWSAGFLTLGMFLGDQWEEIAVQINWREWVAIGVMIVGIAALVGLRRLRQRLSRSRVTRNSES